MHIDFAHFTPVTSLVGGGLIGLAASLLILGGGRILGAAGIFAGALEETGSERQWRLLVILGLVMSPILARLFWGATTPGFSAPVIVIVTAGLLVGFGARLGTGCTSGHGVCGLARQSPRSLVATLVFMTTAFVTVFLVRHIFA